MTKEEKRETIRGGLVLLGIIAIPVGAFLLWGLGGLCLAEGLLCLYLAR